jgi:hypothetical protein
LPLRISNVHVSSISSSAHLDCLDTPPFDSADLASRTNCPEASRSQRYLTCNLIVLRRQGWFPKTTWSEPHVILTSITRIETQLCQLVCHQSSQPFRLCTALAIQYYCIIAANISRPCLAFAFHALPWWSPVSDHAKSSIFSLVDSGHT